MREATNSDRHPLKRITLTRMERHLSQGGFLLPADFVPTPRTVIVGRGREVKENPGNLWLHEMANNRLEEYRDARDDKKLKTGIVTSIVEAVRDACPGGRGAFVKRTTRRTSAKIDPGRWYEVDPYVAREKVGYVFRDLLADEYRSSSKSKHARKRMKERRRRIAASAAPARPPRCSAPPSGSPRTSKTVRFEGPPFPPTPPIPSNPMLFGGIPSEVFQLGGGEGGAGRNRRPSVIEVLCNDDDPDDGFDWEALFARGEVGDVRPLPFDGAVREENSDSRRGCTVVDNADLTTLLDRYDCDQLLRIPILDPVASPVAHPVAV